MSLLLTFLLSLLLTLPDGLPKARKGTFALTNARLITVTSDTLENATLLIQDGKIAAIGLHLALPDSVEIIDCTGLTVYPGLIDSGTRLGLQEIGSLPETRDHDEIGELTPHVRALTAINPNSVLIPVNRIAGVTTVLASPTNGLFPGTAALINLLGYTPDQMYAGFQGVILNFPTTGRRGWWDRRSEEEIQKAAEKALKQLDDVWEKTLLYARIDSAYRVHPEPGRMPEFIPPMESLLKVVRGEWPLLVEVNTASDITKAIDWVQKRKIKRVIFTGVAEGWRVADKLAEAGIPCIVGPVLSLPTRAYDRYDRAYANAGLLHKAGVKVALRTQDAENVRNLPYHAGFAATYGLGRTEALRAITIVPAEIFGVDDRLGSLEVGKSATLFVADGDIFEPKTQVHYVFIDGYMVPMVSQQTRLYEEFLERNPGLVK